MKQEDPNSTLTIDTYIHSAAALRLFDLEVLQNQSDAFVIMGYDFHTPSGNAGPIAPLEGELSILTLMGPYLEKVAKEKLILALPFYGYDWPTSGGYEPRSLSYAEVVNLSNNNNVSWDSVSQTPFFVYTDNSKNERIVYFENIKSLGMKYDYINKKDLKGLGIWALGYDGLSNDMEQLIIEKFGKESTPQ